MPINREMLHKTFGFLNPLLTTTDGNGYGLFRELFDKPEVIQTFHIGYKNIIFVVFPLPRKRKFGQVLSIWDIWEQML